MRCLHIDLLSTTPTNETNPLQCVLNARRLYNSCVDDVQIEIYGIQPVLSFIETEFGGWPILQGSSLVYCVIIKITVTITITITRDRDRA
jgi:hypothetical protein